MKTIAPSNPLPATSVSSENSKPLAVLVDRVSKAYGDVVAVQPLSLGIETGERVALLGPSGSGKTTLLAMIAGELEPSEGSIELRGKDLARLRPGRELCEEVGMIHQQYDLVPNLSALQNVLAGRLGQWSLLKSMVSLVWPRDRQVGLAALERVGVSERARVRAAFLSGGEQQRVAVARLLVQNPAIIVADEPVSSLDPARAEEVMGILAESAREAGKTLVATVHSVSVARAFFDRLIGLRNGERQFDLPSGEVTDAQLDVLYALEGLRDE